MKQISSKAIRALAALLILGLAPDPGSAQSGGVTLAQVLELVRERNPRLRSAHARVQASEAREPAARTLPDPMLQVGAMNLALPDLSADMAMSMAPSVQLMQMFPFPGKLGLRGEIAEDATEMSAAGADETWWQVRTRASTLFYQLYAQDRSIEVMGATLDLLRDLEEIARAMYESGTGRQADVLRATVEIARIDGEIRRMEAMREVAAARLNAVVDRPAETPVPAPLLPALPEEVPTKDTLLAWAEASRPALRRGRIGVERSESRLELARKEIWPDLSMGLQYGQRDRGTGVERMGGIMFGLSLPVWAGRRQLRSRDEARAGSLAARAELEEVRASVRAEIGVELAELRRARRLIELHREEILPQARANVESALSSYRVGSVDFATLVDAELLVNRHEAELHRLVAEYGTALAALEKAVGRPLPDDGHLMAVHP
ncbi:MAG: TolC family protein [Gemmatimonadetes bacterium]|nr:TolC family protein [Gemmatimonadota bacterium]NIR77772.1 TolC family protein [Gemmatimonadota bacterium]NIT86308.1 TolC family protein [Gemmatimonadota bacterium]NIU30142.1 TolC family protein [Gemmatimonadota bacterium]NIU35082.1 TolC family protein [Gemmatimonadota bacterium]